MDDDWSADWDEHGLEQWLVETEEIPTRASDWRPVLDTKAHDLHNEQMADIFRTEGGSSKRGKWRPLAAGTPRSRGILDKTGELKESYSKTRHTSHVWKTTRLGVIAGSNHRLAPIHERGGSRIPQRSVQKSDRQHEALDDLIWECVVGDTGD